MKPIYYDTERENVGDMAYYIPLSEKVGGTRTPCPTPNCAHGCRSKQIFGGAKDISPKSCCATLPTVFLV